MVRQTSVYIVEEHATVRHALVDRLRQAPNLSVLGSSGDATEVIRDVRQAKPDVVLIEVKRKDGMGLEIVRQLAGLKQPPRLIVLTSYATQWEEDSAGRAGADAYVLKDIDTPQLLSVIFEHVKP